MIFLLSSSCVTARDITSKSKIELVLDSFGVNWDFIITISQHR